ESRAVPRRPQKARPVRPTRRTTRRLRGPPLARKHGASSTVGDFGAAVLRPHVLTRTLHCRLFLAEAHGFDLAVGNAEQGERTTNRFRALLSQRKVVFA